MLLYHTRICVCVLACVCVYLCIQHNVDLFLKKDSLTNLTPTLNEVLRSTPYRRFLFPPIQYTELEIAVVATDVYA